MRGPVSADESIEWLTEFVDQTGNEGFGNHPPVKRRPDLARKERRQVRRDRHLLMIPVEMLEEDPRRNRLHELIVRVLRQQLVDEDMGKWLRCERSGGNGACDMRPDPVGVEGGQRPAQLLHRLLGALVSGDELSYTSFQPVDLAVQTLDLIE